jgi:hypothetical protein
MIEGPDEGGQAEAFQPARPRPALRATLSRRERDTVTIVVKKQQITDLLHRGSMAGSTIYAGLATYLPSIASDSAEEAQPVAMVEIHWS